MTSRPLFISVELSIVILAPMFQVGCASASAIVTSRELLAACGRGTGRRSRSTRCAAPPTARPARRHCQIAECSESTGTISPPPAARALATTGPAAIRLSLFASASRLPRLQRGERRRQAREADDRVEHDVGVGSAASSASASGSSAHARTMSAGTSNVGGLLGEELGVAAGREGDDAELVAVPREDVERLRADRPGRSEDGHAARHAHEVTGPRAAPGRGSGLRAQADLAG